MYTIDFLEVHVPMGHWFHFISRAADYAASKLRISADLAEDMQHDMLDQGDEVESAGHMIAAYESLGPDYGELLECIVEYADRQGYKTTY